MLADFLLLTGPSETTECGLYMGPHQAEAHGSAEEEEEDA